jgi:two-component system sensor histidine kinase RpfC
MRLGAGLFAITYVAISSFTQYRDINTDHHALFFSAFMGISLALFTSTLFRNEWPARQYFSLAVDITGISFAIYLTNDATSPIFILYFWIFLSYGTRYGKNHLKLASLISAAAYLITVIAISDWGKSAFEITTVWLSLSLLPYYQFALLRRLHQAKRRAERLHREAEASNQAKSTFLANMSHEIRTPLNGLMSMGQLLQSTTLNTEQQNYVDNLVSSGWALNTVINEVLDFSKIEAGILEIRATDFKLHPLLKEIIQLMHFSAESKSLKLGYRCDPQIGNSRHGDASRLRQVLINLIGNAIRFTRKGEIMLHVDHLMYREDTEWLRFSIVDTGIGIEKSQHHKLFQRFTQLDETLSRGHGGTGLGLAISKHLVEAMGGNIGVNSEPGKGSTFWFELPLLPTQDISSDTLQKTPNEPPLQGLRILLVDDDAINRLAGQRLLELQGCEVLLAGDGEDALNQLRTHSVDLVLMDVHMPVLDGIEATRRIRKSGDSRLPIIGLTASVMKEELERYHDAGMNDVVAKPVEMASLTRTISTVLAG